MMEVPLLKTWIHSVVMEALVTSLVDPGKLDVNLVPADRPSAGRGPGDTLAQGVLTITLSLPSPNPTSDVGKDRDRANSGYYILVNL
jgi:Ca2+-dependent lipid-binding protein